jgi:hypothetical protein
MRAIKVYAKLVALLVHVKSEKNRDSWTTWEFVNWPAPKVEMHGLAPPVPGAIHNSPSMQKILKINCFRNPLLPRTLDATKRKQRDQKCDVIGCQNSDIADKGRKILPTLIIHVNRTTVLLF